MLLMVLALFLKQTSLKPVALSLVEPQEESCFFSNSTSSSLSLSSRSSASKEESPKELSSHARAPSPGKYSQKRSSSERKVLNCRSSSQKEGPSSRAGRSWGARRAARTRELFRKASGFIIDYYLLQRGGGILGVASQESRLDAVDLTHQLLPLAGVLSLRSFPRGLRGRRVLLGEGPRGDDLHLCEFPVLLPRGLQAVDGPDLLQQFPELLELVAEFLVLLLQIPVALLVVDEAVLQPLDHALVLLLEQSELGDVGVLVLADREDLLLVLLDAGRLPHQLCLELLRLILSSSDVAFALVQLVDQALLLGLQLFDALLAALPLRPHCLLDLQRLLRRELALRDSQRFALLTVLVDLGLRVVHLLLDPQQPPLGDLEGSLQLLVLLLDVLYLLGQGEAVAELVLQPVHLLVQGLDLHLPLLGDCGQASPLLLACRGPRSCLLHRLVAVLPQLGHLLVELVDLPALGHEPFPRLLAILPGQLHLSLQLPHARALPRNDIPCGSNFIPESCELLREVVPLGLQVCHLRLVELLECVHVLVVLVVVFVDVQCQLSDVRLQVLDRHYRRTPLRPWPAIQV